MNKLLCSADLALRAERGKKRYGLDYPGINLGKRRFAFKRVVCIKKSLPKRMPGEMRLEIRKKIIVDINKGDKFITISMTPEILESVGLASNEKREDGTLVLSKATEEDGEGCKRKGMNRIGLFGEVDCGSKRTRLGAVTSAMRSRQRRVKRREGE